MILVDSNVPVYLIGAAHPHKVDAQRVLERLVAGRERLVTDAIVLQEIVHRYVAVDRRDAIPPAFDLLLGVVDDVFPVDLACVKRARSVLLSRPAASAREAMHLAVMQEHGIRRILSFDTAFDGLPGVERISA